MKILFHLLKFINLSHYSSFFNPIIRQAFIQNQICARHCAMGWIYSTSLNYIVNRILFMETWATSNPDQEGVKCIRHQLALDL